PDEFKTSRLLPLRLSDGRVRLPGELPLERARVWTEGAWPTEGMTVADFIARELGRVPAPGEKVEIWELPVEIESIDNGRVLFAIVSPPQLDEDDEEREEEDAAR